LKPILDIFIGCRESQDADEQGVSFHPSNETRVVLTAGSPPAITHEKKGHIHGKTKPNLQTWVFPKIGGKNPKWMVKIMENPMNKWMIWGENPLFSKTSIFGHMFQPLSLQGCDFSARKDHRIPARLCPEKFSPQLASRNPFRYDTPVIGSWSHVGFPTKGGEVVMKSLNLGDVFKASY